jgi:hypothetical protein
MFLMLFEAWEGLASHPQGFHVIDDAKPLGYEARPSQVSKNIKNILGTHAFAKPCAPTV